MNSERRTLGNFWLGTLAPIRACETTHRDKSYEYGTTAEVLATVQELIPNWESGTLGNDCADTIEQAFAYEIVAMINIAERRYFI